MISYILSFAFIVLVLQSIPVQCSIGMSFCRGRFPAPTREARVQKRCFAASAWTKQANKNAQKKFLLWFPEGHVTLNIKKNSPESSGL